MAVRPPLLAKIPPPAQFALTFLVIVLFQPILKKYLPQAATPAAPGSCRSIATSGSRSRSPAR